jgi:hypothetical protein
LLFSSAFCEDEDGVERIETFAIDMPGSYQYGREIKRILPVLCEMIRAIQQPEEGSRAKLTRLGLAVQDMLIGAPAKRLSARSTRHAFVEGEGLFAGTGKSPSRVDALVGFNRHKKSPFLRLGLVHERI